MRALRLGPVLAVAVAAAILARATQIAWVQEDANITFRVVDNALNGYGLRWNIDERVQVFTHPLWLLLLIPFSAVFALFLPPAPMLPPYEAIYAAHLTLSLLCVAAMLALLLRHFQNQPFALLGWALIPFLCSAALMDYTSSGLETPLIYAFTAGLILLLHQPLTHWLPLLITYSLLLTTRLDAGLLFLPALALRFYRQTPPWRIVLLGTAPFTAWCAFALIYYGFILPNSYYAKLPAFYPFSEYLRHGLLYLENFALFCPPGIIAFLLGLPLAWLARRHTTTLALLAGAYLHIAYVTCIGGDYMSGRFFAPTLCFLLITFACHARSHSGVATRAALALLLAASLYAKPWAPNQTLLLTGRETFIFNERFMRLPECFFCRQKRTIDNEGWALEGLAYREIAATLPEGRYVAESGSVGQTGLFAGPGVILLDRLRVADPLLARLPPTTTQFTVGHFLTQLPDGYAHARATGDPSQMPAQLAGYYAALRLVTAAPLWSAARWHAILRLNLHPAPAPPFGKERP